MLGERKEGRERWSGKEEELTSFPPLFSRSSFYFLFLFLLGRRIGLLDMLEQHLSVLSAHFSKDG